MTVFKFRGTDTTSDRGHFEIVIEDHSLLSSWHAAKAHLAELGRSDLIPGLKFMGRVEITDGIVYSNVERRVDGVPSECYTGSSPL